MELERLLAQYGQTVQVVRNGQACTTRAFLQPALNQSQEQQSHTPLGSVRRDRVLYLGSPSVAMDDMDQGYVAFWNSRYDVTWARPVYLGESISHWEAALKVRDRE